VLIEGGDRWLPPEEPEGRKWTWPDLDLRPALRFVHVLVVFVAGVAMPGLAGVILVFFSIGLLCRSFTSLFPYQEGLREYRQ
jgi:hypothetical protein